MFENDLVRGYANFKPFDGIDGFMRTFFYDKDYSMPNITSEKEKHNFSTRHWEQIVKDDKAILVYDIHGINPDDLKVTKETENGTQYITIKGTTKNDILDCDMTVNARWAIPYQCCKKPTKKIINSLLYVFVEPEIEKEEVETI